MKTDNPIRILFVEDVSYDAEIAARELQKGGIHFTSTRVDTKEAFLKALEEFQPDIIISDYAGFETCKRICGFRSIHSVNRDHERRNCC
jgi:CheY-like chemotaxis protein